MQKLTTAYEKHRQGKGEGFKASLAALFACQPLFHVSQSLGYTA